MYVLRTSYAEWLRVLRCFGFTQSTMGLFVNGIKTDFGDLFRTCTWCILMILNSESAWRSWMRPQVSCVWSSRWILCDCQSCSECGGSYGREVSSDEGFHEGGGLTCVDLFEDNIYILKSCIAFCFDLACSDSYEGNTLFLASKHLQVSTPVLYLASIHPTIKAYRRCGVLYVGPKSPLLKRYWKGCARLSH